LRRCHVERNYGSIYLNLQKGAQIRLLTAYERLLRRGAKIRLALYQISRGFTHCNMKVASNLANLKGGEFRASNFIESVLNMMVS